MSTLADDLIAVAERVPRELRPLEKQYRFVAEKVRKAQRFVIAPGAHSAIRAVLRSRPSTLATAVSFACLPYPTCWFEWEPPEDATPVRIGQSRVKKCGALFEQQGSPNEASMFTAWKFYDDADHLKDPRLKDFPKYREISTYGVSAVQGGFDFSTFDRPPSLLAKPGWMQRNVIRVEQLEEMRDDIRNGVRFAINSEIEQKALIAIENRLVYRVMDEIDGHDLLAMAGYAGGEEFIKSAVADVSGEIGHMIGTLILINSKNCVELTPIEPPPKLNKARLKAGKTELLPYSTVAITLNRPAARAAAAGRGDAEAMRRHLVRGHFKVRKTGVFWWHFFYRGDEAAGTVERKEHLVKL